MEPQSKNHPTSMEDIKAMSREDLEHYIQGIELPPPPTSEELFLLTLQEDPHVQTEQEDALTLLEWIKTLLFGRRHMEYVLAPLVMLVFLMIGGRHSNPSERLHVQKLPTPSVKQTQREPLQTKGNPNKQHAGDKRKEMYLSPKVLCKGNKCKVKALPKKQVLLSLGAVDLKGKKLRRMRLADTCKVHESVVFDFTVKGSAGYLYLFAISPDNTVEKLLPLEAKGPRYYKVGHSEFEEGGQRLSYDFEGKVGKFSFVLFKSKTPVSSKRMRAITDSRKLRNFLTGTNSPIPYTHHHTAVVTVTKSQKVEK